MFIFWNEVVLPLLRKKKVRRLVEIGALDGQNTRQLLAYCHEANGKLLVIDPGVFPPWEEFKTEYQGRFNYLRDYSLHVLPELRDYDAVFIDGDHNWFTVYHELKAIEREALRSGKFPLVFLHDIDWPYGRRDLYYFPETVPPAFRHPYARLGIVRGLSSLVPEGGVNAGSYHALHEFGPRNGVMTAVEDFLAETKLAISFHSTPYHHGLGLLAPKDKKFDADAIELFLKYKG
ncbi:MULTISPECIES: class I SAM-dependent methyltransferase [Paenibacillus]|uniref:class I SAM-dependent methyltransferase n=1 Tax=Paenibacillus TaxID=44249 RepID=UPI0022B8B275|nr:class I SAM-dependent methyltransferase [Paenibacillus caseinilyticus]MCZ8519174.1 class I SAM-dependent methyltransferase [Paenibacillus caseinilyticus]